MCKISVIIPVYKAENYLEKCLNSVISQSFRDFEIILINDGSPDKSGELCLNIAKTDQRIKYIKKKNGGVASVRNLGIEKANGKYICFVDCDDYIDSDMLEFMFNEAEKTIADIVLCGYKMEIGNSVSEIKAQPDLVAGDDINSHIIELKSKNLIDSPCNKLYRASFLMSSGVRMPENETYEDTDFNLRLLKYKPVISINDRCFYHYILHSGSATRHYDKTKLEIIKKRARLLKECTCGVEKYCDFYYIKSVFSSIIDMFISCKKEEIKNVIKNEINDPEFISAAENAAADGKKNQIIIKAAQSKSAFKVYLFCRIFYLLKYKMQKLFLRVR